MKRIQYFLNQINANFLILEAMIPLTLMDLQVFLEEQTSIQMIYSKCFSEAQEELQVVSEDLAVLVTTIYLVLSEEEAKEEEVEEAVQQADSPLVFLEGLHSCLEDQVELEAFHNSRPLEVAEVEVEDNRILSALGGSASD
jgi:hypothetical protein